MKWRANNMNPALLIAVCLLAAFSALIFKKIDKIILFAVVLFNLVYSIVTAFMYENPIVYEIGSFRPPFGISLVVDNYSLIGIVLLNVIFSLIVLLCFKLIDKYSVVLLISLAALNGIILTGDLFNLFVFLEIGAVAIYILTAMNKGYKHSFNYLILGSLASGLYLFGIVILYNLFGTLNINHIKELIGLTSYPIAKTLALPMILIFIGLSVEAKLIPFSGWVKGVLKNANSLVGALIVSAYSTAILLVFGRLINTIFVMTDGLKIAFTIIAVITLTLAEFSAFSKRNLREILLFSSIAQSGLIVVLFINGLIMPAILVLVNNVISKLVLFILSAKIAKETGTDNINELNGVFARHKIMGLGFTAAAMSLIGLPFFFGFVAKASALIAVFESGNMWLPALILAVSIVEGVYIMRILANLWNTGKEGETAKISSLKDFEIKDYKLTAIVAVSIGVVIIIAGIIPIIGIKEFLSSDFLSFIISSIGGA